MLSQDPPLLLGCSGAVARAQAKLRARAQRESAPFPTVNDVLPLARGDAYVPLDEVQQCAADLYYRARYEQSRSGNTRFV